MVPLAIFHDALEFHPLSDEELYRVILDELGIGRVIVSVCPAAGEGSALVAQGAEGEMRVRYDLEEI